MSFIIKVKKRDGSLEDWSTDKLVTSMTRSGLGVEDANKIVDNVEKWAMEEKTEVLESTKIRDKVAAELMLVDPVSAESFRLFKKD